MWRHKAEHVCLWASCLIMVFSLSHTHTRAQIIVSNLGPHICRVLQRTRPHQEYIGDLHTRSTRRNSYTYTSKAAHALAATRTFAILHPQASTVHACRHIRRQMPVNPGYYCAHTVRYTQRRKHNVKICCMHVCVNPLPKTTLCRHSGHRSRCTPASTLKGQSVPLTVEKHRIHNSDIL